MARSEPRAQTRFAELLADPAHHDVLDYAGELRSRLGPLVREPAMKAALRDLDLDLSGEPGLLLLYVAGPYAWRDDWLENTSIDGLNTVSATTDAVFTQCGAPSTAALTRELTDIGMTHDAAIDFVETRPGLRRFGDRWLRWGSSTADKTEALLHLSGSPASPEIIAAAIGEECQPSSVREVLYADRRFTRATRRTWALRQWGLDEYGGLFAEIGERIDAAGGTISVTTCVRDMTAAFPDVAESSIRTYFTAPGFVVEKGMLRRRTSTDSWPAVRPLNTARGAFHNGRNEIRLAILVNDDILRGSGQPITAAVAAALAVTPDQQRVFTNPHGDLTVTWRLSSPTPRMSSLRAHTTAIAAARGDTMVLAFNVPRSSVDVTRIMAGEDPLARLPALLGQPIRTTPVAALARALRCRPGDVAAILRRRGDTELSNLAAGQGLH